MRRLLPLLALIPAIAPAQPANRPAPGIVRVRIVTSEGALVLALDARRAPKTTANFMAYVDDGRFDGTTFYRAARRSTDPKLGFIQGGIGTNYTRMLPPVAHEPTNVTGIRHLDATVSMARGTRPGSAAGNFFITLGATPNMDASGRYEGYAAFGRLVAGRETVRRILAKPTGGGTGAMKGQMILRPVTLVRAERLDGIARPTPGVKPWLIVVPGRGRTPG